MPLVHGAMVIKKMLQQSVKKELKLELTQSEFCCTEYFNDVLYVDDIMSKKDFVEYMGHNDNENLQNTEDNKLEVSI